MNMTLKFVNFLDQTLNIFKVSKFNIRTFFICSMLILSFSDSGATTLAAEEKPEAGARAGAGGEKECATGRLQHCMNLLQTINKDHNLAFASTEQELGDMCRTMNTGLKCVYSHVTRCFDQQRRDLIYNLLQGTEDVIHLLCSPGPFRERYKMHAPCMKNVSTDSRMCGPQYQMLIESVNPKENVSATDTIRRQCCAFHTYLLCVTEFAESECGSEAAHFIKDYSYRTAGPLIQNQCKNYKAGSFICSLSDSTRFQYSATLLFVLIFIQTLFLHLSF